MRLLLLFENPPLTLLDRVIPVHIGVWFHLYVLTCLIPMIVATTSSLVRPVLGPPPGPGPGPGAGAGTGPGPGPGPGPEAGPGPGPPHPIN